MRVIGVIPARYGSTRLPGKSLLLLHGKPLVQRVVERARQVASLDAVWVATDDEWIASVVRGYGGVAVMTRGDHPSGTDRVAEAVAGTPAELVVNLQGDEPLIDPALIDALVRRMLAEPAWDMGTAVAPLTDPREIASASVVKVVFSAAHQALYFSRAVIPFQRDQEGGPPSYWRHIGLYAYRRSFLERLVAEPPCAAEQAEKLEQLRALHLGGRILVVETEDVGIGVDTEEDAVRVAALIREQEQ